MKPNRSMCCVVFVVVVVLLSTATTQTHALEAFPIGVQCFIKDVRLIASQDSLFEVDVSFWFTWNNATAREGDSTEGMWLPSISSGNLVKTEVQFPSTIIIQDGVVQLRTRRRAKYAFRFDFKRFPFDTQSPHILLEPGPHPDKGLILVPTQEDDADQLLDNTDDFHVEGWDNYDNPVAKKHLTKDGTGATVHGVFFGFDVDRQYGSFLTQNILPAFVFVMVAWAGFWVDFTALMPRLMPILFSVVALSNLNTSTANFVPRANEITWFEMYALLSTIWTAAVLVELVIVHNLARRGHREWAKVVDLIARFFFPASYLVAQGFIALMLALEAPLYASLLYLFLGSFLVLVVLALYTVWRIIYHLRVRQRKLKNPTEE